MEDLVEKAKHGNEEAFISLMLLLKDELYKIARLRLKDESDIEDAIQETTIKAYKSIKRLKEIKYFKTWIIKILINQSNNIYMKNKRRINIIEFNEANSMNIIQSDELETLEDKLDFEFMCKNLKYEERMIVILYYMYKYTDKEIGRILRLNENTVTTRRTRAKKKIQIILNERKNNNG